jgi:predicted dehydrogenase
MAISNTLSRVQSDLVDAPSAVADRSRCRVAVVGLQNQGLEHVAALQNHPNAELVALCDRSEMVFDRLPAFAARLPRFHDVNELAMASDIDAWIVAVPHHAHPAVIQAATVAGVHVLKEKPLGRTLTEGLQLVSTVESTGKVLFTGVQRRQHATYLDLAVRLRDRRIRSVRAELTVVPKPGTATGWRSSMDSGGGVLLDLGYHAIDTLHFLLGPMVPIACTTYADGKPCGVDVIEDECRVWAQIRHTPVSLHVGRAAHKREFFGFETDDGLFAADRRRVWHIQDGIETTLFQSDSDWSHTMKRQIADFCQVIETGQHESSDTLAEQIPTQRFIDRCYAMRRVYAGLQWTEES